jgi:hypothetical protein
MGGQQLFYLMCGKSGGLATKKKVITVHRKVDPINVFFLSLLPIFLLKALSSGFQ